MGYFLRWAPDVTGEKMLNTFFPGRGFNQDLLRGSQTLYRVAIKASLYRKAVQVCIIPNINTDVLPQINATKYVHGNAKSEDPDQTAP